MSWRNGRAIVALDGSSLHGVVLGRGFGPAQARARERVALGQGALVPSPSEPNLKRREVVKAALVELLEQLGRPPRATLILPLGTARLCLLEPPAGAEPREYARFRLGPGLGVPPEEAIVDAMAVGLRAIGAAVRRAIVADYEKLAADCGLLAERVDLMPLPALADAERPPAPPRLDVFLGDAAFAVALRQAGELTALHTRWRGPWGAGADRIGRLLERLARDLPGGRAPGVRVLGEGSAAVAAALCERGQPAEAGPEGILLGSAA